MRLLPLMILLLPSLVVANPIHRSNALGQDLGEISEGETTEWSLSDGTLYHNGEAVQEISHTDGVVTIKDLDGDGLWRREYQDSRLVREEQDGVVYVYRYDGEGRLASVAATKGDDHSLTLFAYNRADGTLSAVIQSGKGVFFPTASQVTVTDGAGTEQFQRFGNGYGLRLSRTTEGDGNDTFSVTVDEEGNTVYQRTDGDAVTLETYDQQGDLVHRVMMMGDEKRSDETYVYQDGDVVRSVAQQENGTITINEYENGTLVSSVICQDGAIQKEIRYSQGIRSEETVYSEGKPYAVITYRQDGKSVGGVRYL